MINFSLSQRNMLAINLCIASLFLATLAYIAWSWHNDWIISHQTITVKPLETKPDDSNTMIAAIPNAHIFGKSLGSIGSVPMSSLQFKVTGIAKVDHGKLGLSKAYISLAGGPSKIFQVGDNLPYGVKVYDITGDSVILENDGHLEKLTLTREKLEFKARNSLERKSDA